jgi:DNA alkylation repair enzyme
MLRRGSHDGSFPDGAIDNSQAWGSLRVVEDCVAGLAERIDGEVRGLADGGVAAVRRARRRWSARLRAETADVVFGLGVELVERFGWRWVGYELILYHPSALGLVDGSNVERLAGRLASWGEVDQFGILLAGPAWRAGRIDDATVHGWARRADRWWRRAALVSTVPLNTRSQGGRGDTARTLGMCELLVHDRDDLVVKALSWALRALVAHDPHAVDDFLATRDAALAARVRREVRAKLSTGRKNPPRTSTQPAGVGKLGR